MTTLRSRLEPYAIVALCVAGGVLYGIGHDLVTAHLCLEYFRPPFHHPPFVSDSPIRHAFYFGFAATWWAGLLNGLFLAIAAQIGHWPRRTAGRLIKPVCVVFLITGLVSAAAGVRAYAAEKRDRTGMPDAVPRMMDQDRDARLAAVIAAHRAVYPTGIAGGMILCIVVFAGRLREHFSNRSGFTNPETTPASAPPSS